MNKPINHEVKKHIVDTFNELLELYAIDTFSLNTNYNNSMITLNIVFDYETGKE